MKSLFDLVGIRADIYLYYFVTVSPIGGHCCHIGTSETVGLRLVSASRKSLDPLRHCAAREVIPRLYDCSERSDLGAGGSFSFGRRASAPDATQPSRRGTDVHGRSE